MRFSLRLRGQIVAVENLKAVFPASLSAARAARTFLERQLPQLPAHHAGDLLLLVSELINNSVKHAGVEDGSPIEVSVSVGDDRLRAEVCDRGAGFRKASPSSQEWLKESGYGLSIVEAIADRWGIRERDGLCVWFEINTLV